MSTTGDRRVDDLRQQLKSLGYLDAGVDRFVLGPARGERRPAAIAWFASIRIGVIAAILMGPAAAIGAAARMPGLITGPRDGFVIAVYMGLLFGAGVCLVACAAILIVSWVASRTGHGPQTGRRAAIIAGGAITIASLAYLTLWWDASSFRTSSGIPGASGLLGTVLALAFAAAVSLLLGHVVTVTALAVTVARGGADTEIRGVPGTSRRVIAAAGLLTFCGALLLFNFTAASDRASGEAPVLTVVPSGLRVRLIAIDGFDPEVARRLAEDGRTPAFAAALDGTRAAVEIGDTTDPARAWTTVATGTTADVHAVRGLETRRVAGVQGTLTAGQPSTLGRAIAAATDLVRLTRPSIARGDERRVKTLWEVASGAGLRTAVVNWWATWPAPSNSGIVVTDRAILRLERGGDLDAEIAPRDTYDRLRERWPDLRTRASERAATVAGTIEEGLLRRSAELDALLLGLTREVSGDTIDLVCTYFPGLDVVQHGLLTTPEGAALPPSAMAARLDALEAYYVFLDRLLGELLAPGHGEIVMLVTSPGRIRASTAGLFAVRGAATNARVRDASARPTDIMPTVLYALGVPLSRELAGRALIELFSADHARRYPVREVSSYGRPGTSEMPRSGKPLDQEMIDRLRSLGYVR